MKFRGPLHSCDPARDKNGCLSRQLLNIMSTTQFQPIYKAAAALYHALIHQPLIGLIMADPAAVIKKLGPHPAVEEVADRMFRTPDIEVHLAPVIGSGTG